MLWAEMFWSRFQPRADFWGSVTIPEKQPEGWRTVDGISESMGVKHTGHRQDPACGPQWMWWLAIGGWAKADEALVILWLLFPLLPRRLWQVATWPAHSFLLRQWLHQGQSQSHVPWVAAATACPGPEPEQPPRLQVLGLCHSLPRAGSQPQGVPQSGMAQGRRWFWHPCFRTFA